MVKDPSKGVTACEDFFLLVVEAHILVAAMQVFGMSSLDSTPSNTTLFPVKASGLDSLQRRKVLMLAIKEIIDQFIDMSLPETLPDDDPGPGPSERKTRLKKSHKSKTPSQQDHVRQYAGEVLTIGLLLMEFIDAIREGDGLRNLRCWRVFLPIMKATNRTNYSIEAFNLLAQHDFVLSPRAKQQIIWERTVNVSGVRGKNISCDLFMEHLNRECKGAMGSLGSNINSSDCVTRIGKSLGGLTKITDQYDKVNNAKTESGLHLKPSDAADLAKITQELNSLSVFKFLPGREHKQFPKFISNPCKLLKIKDLKAWMEDKLKQIID